MMGTRKSVWWSLLLLSGILLSSAVFAQEAPSATEEDTVQTDYVHIDNANRLWGKKIDTSEYVYLVGDVELSQDSVFFYCDSAVIIDKKQIDAFGNVTIQKGDTLTIYADTMYYHSDSLEAELLGDVVLESGEDQLWTTKLLYDLNFDIAFYDRGAVMLNDSTQISSRIGVYWVNSSLAKLRDSVVVIGEEVTLLSDSLLYRASDQWTEFIGPTLILQDDARIYCESGFYDVQGRSASFRQNAEYIRGEEIARADTIDYTGATSLVELRGNAYYEEEDQVITSDTIKYYQDSGDVEVMGNAYFRDSTRDVTSDVIFYNKETEIIRTAGRSNLVEGDQTLLADSIDFDQTTGLGIARGQVVFIDTAANSIIECDFAEYDRTSDYVKAFGKTRPLLKSIMDQDTMFLTADTLLFENIPDTTTQDTFNRFSAFADVRLFKSNIQGLCDSLVFESTDSIFHMLGNPILWSDTTQFTSDTIDIALKNDRIDKVYLVENGLIVNIVESIFYNQIKGKHMVARFEEEEVRDLLVTGNAESIYYARDDDNAFIGVNQVAASEIRFTFLQKELSGIRMYSQPDGGLKPMEMVDHNTLRLEGFVWREKERPRELVDLY